MKILCVEGLPNNDLLFLYARSSKTQQRAILSQLLVTVPNMFLSTINIIHVRGKFYPEVVVLSLGSVMTGGPKDENAELGRRMEA